MPEIEFEGEKYRTDEAGFIQDPEKWFPKLAEFLAKKEGIGGLTSDHWKVINCIRDHYLKFGVAPLIEKLRKETGFTLRQIHKLFPQGPAKSACKIAGLTYERCTVACMP